MKKLLVLNFFPAFIPPTSGGELRYFHIYDKLSKYFDVTLLSPTYNDAKVEVIEHSDTFREYRIPKEDIHNVIHWKLEQEEFSPEFSSLTCAYSGEQLNNYHRYYLNLYKEVDIIIHESPFMLNYDLFFGIDNKPRIYNSYNIEYNLLSQIYKNINAKEHLEYIFQLEKRLVEQSSLVFATSSEEKEKFQDLYNVSESKIKIAEDFLKRKEKIKRKTAFFIGSGHPPNTEAVHFIINNLADKCSDVTFLIAGTCCNGIDSKKVNVKLLGMVDEDEKKTLFQTSDIAINPMFSGAGTNLKTLEYLSMGIPMISTDVGARGIDIEDGKHFILATQSDFSQKLNELMTQSETKDMLSNESKKYINEHFNWKSIAKNIYNEILNIQETKKKNLLLLNDFEVSSPFGGGEIRINKLYRELSKTYHVLLLCLNESNNIKSTWITDAFLEISFPKTEEHIKEQNRVNSKYLVSANDIINSYMITNNNLFMSTINAVGEEFDITVLCHPYMYEVIDKLKSKYLVYESLNDELMLKKELFREHSEAKKLIAQVHKVESKSCKESEIIISVSDTDHEGLQNYANNKKLDIVTIKNGVEIITDFLYEKEFTSVKELFSEQPIVLFIGSAHMPNIDSAKFILKTLAIELPKYYFVIIGSVCDAIVGEKTPSNVLLFGKLEDEIKNVLFSIADIAINPMFGGSGSNLKLAEYFAWKLPTVTTEFGARGYTIHNGEEAIICKGSEFSSYIKKIQTNQVLSDKLSEKAFAYAQSNLEWSVLGKQFRDLLDTKVFSIKRKKLLIVTYRFTTPPLGGAEVYMYELIKGLDNIGDFDITVAYLDTYDIENLYHFSIHSTQNTKVLQHPFKHVTFKKFEYDELEDNRKLENSKILMKNWTVEFLESARKFLKYYNKPLLMGGWNFFEKVEETSQVWSTETSEIYIQHTKTIFLKGFSPSKKLLTFSMHGNVLYEKSVNGNFDLDFTIEKKGILAMCCNEEYIGDDIRPLGVLLKVIECDKQHVDILYSYRDFLKENNINEYMDELIYTANNRDEYLDVIFQETRGVNSKELEIFLDKNIIHFDSVLGHSIPFATTPIVSKYALKHNKDYTLLPHFHFDDEFYHWKSYYTAMQKANIVFTSPKVSIDLFYNKLNIPTIEVPGGGITKGEYENIDRKFFLELYQSDKPFFIVLGRKSGAKNYASIIQAIENVNEKEHICNLVMIGRDEDNIKIDSKYTYYFGEQPRNVVLGALQECHGLVTMSESESFGIVIVEAWMLSKPVIINEKCPAFVELVTNKKDGLYVNINK